MALMAYINISHILYKNVLLVTMYMYMYLFTGRMKKEIRRPNMREDWGISLQYSVAGNRIVKMKLNTHVYACSN